MEVEDEDGIRLSEIYTGKNTPRFIYEYDFGDSWQHEIVLEKSPGTGAEFKYPAASKERERVHRRTWEASGAMPSSSKPSVTQITRITLIWWNGSAASLTRRSSRWTR